jgi:hypothetical protein
MEVGPVDQSAPVYEAVRWFFEIIFGERGIFDKFPILHKLAIPHSPNAFVSRCIQVGNRMGSHRSEHTQRRDSGTTILGYFFNEIPSSDFGRAHFPFSFCRLGLKMGQQFRVEPKPSISLLSILEFYPPRIRDFLSIKKYPPGFSPLSF